jgi:hypothetical protein
MKTGASHDFTDVPRFAFYFLDMLIPKKYDMFIIPNWGSNMATKKIAITIPDTLLFTIDEIRRQKKLSRSKVISSILMTKINEDTQKQIRAAYDEVYSDEEIKKEQLATARWFESSGSESGQEW